MEEVIWFRVNLETHTNLNTIQILDPDQEEVYKVPLITTRQTLCFCRPQSSTVSVKLSVRVGMQNRSVGVHHVQLVVNTTVIVYMVWIVNAVRPQTARGYLHERLHCGSKAITKG